ncbi:MAG: NAD-dependent epimerase/dehydratase family protein [Candidatus Binataceae bacterium]
MTPRRVLVTGGTGVNGVWVVRQLIERGITPVVFDWRADLTFLKDVRDRFELFTGDIRDLAALLRVIKRTGADAILHLAALMPDAAQADPKSGFEINALGTVIVLEAARIAEIKKVIFTSSKAAYGVVSGEFGHPVYRPLGEDYPARPVSVYDVTKLASEGMGINYARNYGVDFIALRFSAIFGPGKLARHGILSIHGRMIENVMLGKPVRIPRGAEQRDDVIYVKDVARSILQALDASGARSRIFHIGSGQPHSLLELASILREFYPKADIEIGPGLDFLSLGHMLYSVHDISRARDELGFEPQFDLRAGVRDYIDMMNQYGVSPSYTPDV